MELTIRELAATAAAAVAAADLRGASRRVTDLPDERTIRWYSTIGLLDRPTGNRGRTALYGDRHVMQLVAIKRRQAEGRTLAEIQAELVGATDRTLRKIADLPAAPDGASPSAPDGASPSEATASTRQFWRERPAVPHTAPILAGVPLGGGVVLMLPRQPGGADAEDIRAAARPLLDLLAQRRLTEGGTS
jgi:DNA-binding transcriptional MerR regulator